MSYGFIRVVSASPLCTLAECEENAKSIIACAREACDHAAQLVVFPELSVTGYTCGDLFQQRTLQQAAVTALLHIASETSALKALLAVGLPLAYQGALYNVAAILFRGKILALIPKTFIPNYSEFYERRQFSPAPAGIHYVTLDEQNQQIPFGTDIIIQDSKNPLFALGVELCEDVWTPNPPSIAQALSGATVIANLSASNEIIGKASYRRLLIASQSAKICAAYVYANAGTGESTTDMVFSAHNLIAENGKLLSESPLFSSGCLYADIDLEQIDQERKRTTTFADARQRYQAQNNHSPLYLSLSLGFDKHSCDETGGILRTISTQPFVPQDGRERMERARAVIELQAQALVKRLRHTHAQTAVIGLSGGLDSTLALLVCCRAFSLCNIDSKQIQAITMPCFGTTNRTLTNARKLAECANTSLSEIPIAAAVRQHFADIGQKEEVHDVTYENCQARERTQVLMDVANKSNGLVIGTGDLSEQALGWATYNGDHMSMYGVNASIPKTLVRHLVEWFKETAQKEGKTALAEVLQDILDTPVSPELLPPEADNSIAQKTEKIVGPYELHDFFLYYVLRFGFTPKKVFFLAERAFIAQPTLSGAQALYTRADIKKWLISFYRRFFSQQFKRSCMPDGAKVGTINLSPRGDWRMPSDAVSHLWISEAEKL